ncbi:MAG TPA: cupin domain-containing protein [Gaiellaceae bacterium]|nr:cupin domain-containing protein [Gaiellaceae bacterium]
MPRADQVVAPIEGSALALDRRGIAPGASAGIGDPESDTLVYVTAGKGSISLGGELGSLATRDAALVLAGEEARIGADEALDLVVLSVGAEVDRHAPMGPRALTTSLDDAEAEQATGARSFQILFDASNGSTRATLFAGYVPPGTAPWHYHLYDEIVWIPEGPARLHVEGAVEDLGPGSAFRLRPREVHIVENPSDDRELTIIGLFTPAGSPSAAYLTAEVAAEYRFAG